MHRIVRDKTCMAHEIPLAGEAIYMRFGKKAGWIWLSGNRRSCTVHYAKTYKASYNPGLASLIEEGDFDMAQRMRDFICRIKGKEWRYATITYQAAPRAALYEQCKNFNTKHTKEGSQ